MPNFVRLAVLKTVHFIPKSVGQNMSHVNNAVKKISNGKLKRGGENMKRDKLLAKLLETLVIKALKQEGKEPTTENVEAFIDNALKEIEEENK